MNKEKTDLKALLSKLPGLPNLDHLIDRMPSAARLKVMEAEFALEPILKLDLDVVDINEVVALAHLTPSPSDERNQTPSLVMSGTTSITIRVQNRVLAAMKAQAGKKCIGYQTHINRLLKAAVAHQAPRAV